MSQSSAPTGRGDSAEKSRYRETLNLPSTTFAMKANLVQNEPASVKRWAAADIYAQLRGLRKGRSVFSFHDGPPYANASLHLGHLLNKSLKDFVVRTKSMAGFDCPYVPGWDCHGLPIEHKVMTDLIAAGKFEKLRTLTDDQRRLAVRRECQKHAEKYVKLQMGQVQRLLTVADYGDPYLTMLQAFEGATLDVLASLADEGLVFRALKPVHWSIANETALAEAELEYQDREDISVYVDFETTDADAAYDAFDLPRDVVTDAEEIDLDAGARPGQRPSLMIWTTTPWTLPANLAVAVNADAEYALARIDGNVTILAADLVDRVAKNAGATDVAVLARTSGKRLVGLRYRHPFVEGLPPIEGDTSNVYSVVAADYVTLEDGTGLVHTAPGHGTEDYQTGLREKLPIYCPVRHDGTYDATVPEWLRGLSIWDANSKVVTHLRESGHLFHDHVFTHSYPHDWRSKTPVIFRCTEQWFVGVDRATKRDGVSLRAGALAAIDPDSPATVKFVPEWGRNRMRGMLDSRPDWCISRQRAWGLPIPAFVRADGGIFMTPASIRAVASVVREKGADAWFQSDAPTLLAHYDPATDPDAPKDLTRDEFDSLRKGPDILDVWFESGSTWHAVLRTRGLAYPADLYLEGSDQHRGWFQTSILTAVGVTGRSPYKTLLTHGFIVDKDGRKLSKSRPDAAKYELDNLCTDFGVDVLRWWVSSLAYENDTKVDLEFFASAGESYRKLRNTLRFMMSNLGDFELARDGVDIKAIAPTSIDAWALSKCDELSSLVRDAYERFDFRAAHLAIFEFCNDTLSAMYLSATKDRLYCDAPGSPRRRRTQTAFHRITDTLCRLIAPLCPHTADEAYRALHRADAASPICVHLEEFASPSGVTADAGWFTAMQSRTDALLALEQARGDESGDSSGAIGDPLDAGLELPDPDGSLARLDPNDLADFIGVSRATIIAGKGSVRVINLREAPRCERSRKRDATVRVRSDGGMLSDRDAAAVGVA